jgi:hypothetical protein
MAYLERSELDVDMTTVDGVPNTFGDGSKASLLLAYAL